MTELVSSAVEVLAEPAFGGWSGGNVRTAVTWGVTVAAVGCAATGSRWRRRVTPLLRPGEGSFGGTAECGRAFVVSVVLDGPWSVSVGRESTDDSRLGAERGCRDGVRVSVGAASLAELGFGSAVDPAGTTWCDAADVWEIV